MDLGLGMAEDQFDPGEPLVWSRTGPTEDQLNLCRTLAVEESLCSLDVGIYSQTCIFEESRKAILPAF